MTPTFHYKMQPDEMASYIRFSAEEGELLRELWPHVAPEVDRICAVFYDRALSHSVTAAILGDPARVGRLMKTLKVWLAELLQGPWDAPYWARRERIGQVHVEVGLPPAAMFTAMAVVRAELAQIIFSRFPQPQRYVAAVCKITELDVGVMTGSYYDQEREKSLAELENVLVSNIPSPAILLDSNDMVTAATPAIHTLTGTTHIIGRTLHDALPPELIRESDLAQHILSARRRRRSVTLPRVDVPLGDRVTNLAITVVPLDHTVDHSEQVDVLAPWVLGPDERQQV